MTNEERIKRLRKCATWEDCGSETCDFYSESECRNLLLKDAADALEAADEKIEELQKQVNEFIKNETRSTVIKVMSRRIAELEAQLPKEGEWKKILQNGDGTSDYQCSACLGIIMDVPDDDEHPLCSFCPNCGAKMKKGEEE